MIMRYSLYILLSIFLAACARQGGMTSIVDYNTEMRQHRAKYKADLSSNEHSPISVADTVLLDFYPVDPAYRCDCAFVKEPSPEPFEMSTYAGTTKEYFVFGRAQCQVAGQAIELELYRSPSLLRMPQYRNYTFLPFKDHSNGGESYGGGRYINLEIPDPSISRIIIDFNKAYNPYCAYSEGYKCPIPPVANHLDLRIPAGEKAWRGEHKSK